jgi:predicted phosphodiesterase
MGENRMRYKKETEEDLETMTNKAYEKVVVVPDLHCPYEDKKSVKAVLNYIKDQKPDRVVFIGDAIDMYSVSRFDRNPKRANRLQYELDRTIGVLEQFRLAAPKAKMTYIEGNHEDRMKRYLWKHPELHDLRCLELSELLDLDRLDIGYVNEWYWKDTLLVTHGKRVNKYAARAELDDHGVSGVSGHTHKVQSHCKTDYKGVKVWHSIGHLCDAAQAEYVSNPDWQQALGILHLARKGKRFYAEVIPIVDHKFVYGGRHYSPKGVDK